MAVSRRPSIGVAVITHRAVSLLPGCLPSFLASPLRPTVLVVNSSSNDGTVELAKEMGAETLVIPRSEFNHGATRELARRALGTDIAVMTTPDTKPLGPDLVDNLIRPIVQGEASISYARQLPHDGADFFEAFPRVFNYPEKSGLRSIQDVKRLGAYAFFCSDSCAAWSNAALDTIGGFAPTLSLEDVIATTKLLHAGHKIAYCADAVVKHSHHHSLMQELKRHFDTGYVRAEHKHLLFEGGGDERRGAAYMAEMLCRLSRERPHLIPYALANTAIKYFGYRLGFHGRALPLWLKRRVSAQPYFWQNTGVTAGSLPTRSELRGVA